MLQNSITEYVVYGENSHNRYVIGKMGICFNEKSIANPNFGKWYVSKNISLGNGEILLNTSKWEIKFKVNPSLDEQCWFDTAEQALEVLQNVIQEKLSNKLKTKYPQTALEAFEEYIKNDQTKGISPDIFLEKLNSIDPKNPEFLHHCVDSEWQVWRKAWNSCLKK